METRDLDFIARSCAGEVLAGTPALPVTGVCTDSRQTRAGDVFFALPGERFDGHDFLHEAAAQGAAAVVLEPAKISSPLPRCAVVAVADTRQALGRLATAYRQQFNVPFITVGGSNGKTTTKELIASVLRQKLSVLWSEASFNNRIGVPLTLLQLNKSHQAAVLEAGTNHPGELTPLVKMIQPAHGVITGIGREHLEFFGSIAGVAEEEGWLGELLPPGGKLFLNGDSQWAAALIRRTRASVVRLGVASGNHWRAHSVRLNKDGATFRVESPNPAFSGQYHISLLGKHQILNALFAIAVGAELGLARDQIERGLAGCRTLKMRLQLWEHNGVRVLDDAYNANADSTLVALETLQYLPCKGRRLAVLGDMAELGAYTEPAHEEVGRRAAQLGIGQLFAVGKMAPVTARAARAAGLNRVLEFADVESAAAAVRSFVKSGDLLLLKASRAGRLERIAEALKLEKS